jgi:hypothetical protein
LGQCPKPGLEQFDFHAELADALHGGGELAVGGGGLALLQRTVERGFGLLAPPLELGHRQAELTGERLGGLAAQQAQDDLALARNAPALTRRQRAGATRGQRGRARPALAAHRPIGCVCRRRDDTPQTCRLKFPQAS